MSNDTETTAGLTTDDIAALRSASRMVVRFTGDSAELECIRELPRRVVKGYDTAAPEEVRRTISIRSHWRGTACFVSCYIRGAWQALALVARPGDEVIGRCSENGNGYLNRAIIPAETWTGDEMRYHGCYTSLHHDCCWITLRRKGKTLIHDLMVESSICPDNTARAIQSGPGGER